MITNKWRLAQKLELKWWRRYLQSKDIDTYLSQKEIYWNRILNENEIEIPEGRFVLDAGCGPAGINMVLPQAKVIAIDPLLEQYQKQLPHFDQTWYPWVQFETRMLENYSSQQSFDYIFCMNVINHVNDIQKALKVLKTNLSAQGQLILSVDVHKSQFLKTIFQRLPGDVLHPHQFDLTDYKNLFQQTGFNIQGSTVLKKGSIFDYYLFTLK